MGRENMFKGFVPNRPWEIQKFVDYHFDLFVKETGSSWTFNGSTSYNLAYIDDVKLALHIIKNGTSHVPQQLSYSFIDLGAGDFRWSKNMAALVNSGVQSGEISSNIKLKIYGLRGESHNGLEKRTEGVCTIYDFGNFKLEDLAESFLKKGVPTEEQNFDLVISRKTLVHLVDPLAMIMQVHAHLKKDSGFFVFDSSERYFILNKLSVLVDGEVQKVDLYLDSYEDQARLRVFESLLCSMGVEYIDYKDDNRDDAFLIRKTSDIEVRIDYLKILSRSYERSFAVYEDVKTEGHCSAEIHDHVLRKSIMGSSKLYEYIKQNDIMWESSDFKGAPQQQQPAYGGEICICSSDGRAYTDKQKLFTTEEIEDL
jgi:SAM-dependent methyltransferase